MLSNLAGVTRIRYYENGQFVQGTPPDGKYKASGALVS
jgi:hypothetical protein